MLLISHFVNIYFYYIFYFIFSIYSIDLIFLSWRVATHSSSGQVTVTQSPGSQSVGPGQTVSIRCTSSLSVDYNGGKWLHWYFHKPGEAPKLLIYKATGRHSGVSDRFRGSASSGTDFTLTISGVQVQAEDSGVYYCNGWFHICNGTNVF
uniref:Ig-like domain-containing protein n=1 Tax=Lates calcarifer TaxID=8187 RepID=A0A4W6CFK1_LATCA